MHDTFCRANEILAKKFIVNFIINDEIRTEDYAPEFTSMINANSVDTFEHLFSAISSKWVLQSIFDQKEGCRETVREGVLEILCRRLLHH